MSHEKLVCNRFHEPRKLHSEISGVVKMRNDNLDNFRWAVNMPLNMCHVGP